ncbi:steroid dehydrogenase, putative [Plasmodium ovale wallikeri]|uniref:Steroid dehydrogenase, putative n=1 Tax=Plasmodium ovale wallikeri TaxID=864142 RepID=A0A1A8YM68_PLAOA|nr:steroid dehydrogenase, putative [Plasmodium ovale wallikeri]SBT33080.1 steroid dehydrogenase, putative [Plasmodium ovale wallikeri]
MCLKSKLFLNNLKSYGETVLITGCTDGIGKSLAYALIKHGVNLLLISRNEKELKNIKKDLLEKNKNFKGTIDYISFDYNEHNFSSYKSLQDKVQKHDIGVLINNVGISYPHPLVRGLCMCVCVCVYTHVYALLNSCVYARVYTHAYGCVRRFIVLPRNGNPADRAASKRESHVVVLYDKIIMIKKKKGLILYTSSGVTALQSSPLYAIYASVKDGICSFANSLSVGISKGAFTRASPRACCTHFVELREHNIQVQCHVPLFIVTKLSKIRKPSLFVPTSDVYAQSVIQKMKEGNILPSHAEGPKQNEGKMKEEIADLKTKRWLSVDWEVYGRTANGRKDDQKK